MSNFGEAREATDGSPRKLYTGVENFRVLSVNPTHEELKKMYGDNAKESVYTGMTDVNGTPCPQVTIALHLDNDPDIDAGEERIAFTMRFWVTKTPLVSVEKGKQAYINLFGDTSWLTKAEAEANKDKYVTVGAKGSYTFYGNNKRPALRGEEDFIQMLRNLLNLTSPDKAEKEGDISVAASMLTMEDWNTVFSGNFGVLKNIISTTNNKIGLLLGVKQVEDKIYQDVFTKQTLRQYIKGKKTFDYLKAKVLNEQARGAYPNTVFGETDFELREYNPDAKPTMPDDVFNEAKPATGSFFGAEAADAFAGKEAK